MMQQAIKVCLLLIRPSCLPHRVHAGIKSNSS